MCQNRKKNKFVALRGNDINYSRTFIVLHFVRLLCIAVIMGIILINEEVMSFKIFLV